MSEIQSPSPPARERIVTWSRAPVREVSRICVKPPFEVAPIAGVSDAVTGGAVKPRPRPSRSTLASRPDAARRARSALPAARRRGSAVLISIPAV